MKTQNKIRAEIGDFVKSVGKMVVSGLAQTAIVKYIVPRVTKVGGTVLDKMAHMQGRKDVEDLDRLARESQTVIPPAPTPPPAIKPDGPIEAKFI